MSDANREVKIRTKILPLCLAKGRSLVTVKVAVYRGAAGGWGQ